jgi:hypothetical protein
MWQVAHGDTPDAIRNNPALKGLNIPKTGQPGNVGLEVTIQSRLGRADLPGVGSGTISAPPTLLTFGA